MGAVVVISLEDNVSVLESSSVVVIPAAWRNVAFMLAILGCRVVGSDGSTNSINLTRLLLFGELEWELGCKRTPYLTPIVTVSPSSSFSLSTGIVVVTAT